MGASFIERTLEGNLTVKQVKKHYDSMEGESQDSYSGDWNMCPGVKVRPDMVFENYQRAEEWLSENCQKWENAIAVRYKTVKKPTYNGKQLNKSGLTTFDRDLGEKFRLTATDYYSGQQGQAVLADQLTAPQKEKAKKLVNAYLEAKTTFNKAADEFSSIRQNFNTLTSEFTDYTGLRMARNKATLALKALEGVKARLIAYNDERTAKFYEEKTVSLGEKWLIGGRASC